MTEPRVSILVPCFQSEPTLAELFACLEQVRWANLELVLVNDGSTDRTGPMIEGYSRQSRHSVVVAHQGNSGAASARNLAFKRSAGRYVQYLDADDLIDPDKLATQVTSLEATGEDINAGSWGRFNTNPDETSFVAVPEPNLLSAPEYLKRHLAESLMTHPAAFVVRRTLIESAGGFREDLSLNDDGEFFARMIAAAGTIRFLPEAKCHYRSHVQGSLSGRRSAAALESSARAMIATADIAASLERSESMQRAAGIGLARVAAYIAPHDPKLAREVFAEARRRCPDAAWNEGTRTYRMMRPIVGWLSARILEHRVAHWRNQRGNTR